MLCYFGNQDSDSDWLGIQTCIVPKDATELMRTLDDLDPYLTGLTLYPAMGRVLGTWEWEATIHLSVNGEQHTVRATSVTPIEAIHTAVQAAASELGL